MTALTKDIMGSLVPMWSAWTKPLATSIDISMNDMDKQECVRKARH